MKDKYRFIHNVFLDSCAFDPKIPEEQRASFQILKWAEDMTVVPIIPHSVIKELEHPNTPKGVKAVAMQFVYTYKVSLTPEQRKQLQAIESIVIGKGDRANYKNDAMHIFIADDSGRYFITTENRLIRKKDEIKRVSTGLEICKPTEFVEIVENDRKFQIEHRERMNKLRGINNS